MKMIKVLTFVWVLSENVLNFARGTGIAERRNHKGAKSAKDAKRRYTRYYSTEKAGKEAVCHKP